MGKVFAYARVSTTRQGERGVSLSEQRDAITRYAERQGLEIVRWFEEQESASKQGRPEFNQMLRLLRLGHAVGVVIHKIDRSARNLEDWNDIGKLVDAGVDVHFATESIDLKKGFYGRLKQGFYPMGAPLGYLDQGAAKAKVLDPIQGPLVKDAFELYGSSAYSLPTLVREMFARGLRNRHGGKVTINGLSTILRNPFYVGVIRIRRTGQTFKGNHEPLISVELFERAQAMLSGKRVDRVQSHIFVYSRIVHCATCKYSLIAERKKGHVYYRCHNRPFKTPAVCPPTSVREEAIDEAVVRVLSTVQLSENEAQAAREYLIERRKGSEAEHTAMQNTLKLQHGQVSDRISKLTDLLVDGTITKPMFHSKQQALLLEQTAIEQKMEDLNGGSAHHLKQLETAVELAKDVSMLYQHASVENKRKLLKILLSNLTISSKNIEIMLSVPFRLISEREKSDYGGAYRGTCRTWSRLLEQINKYLCDNPATHLEPIL